MHVTKIGNRRKNQINGYVSKTSVEDGDDDRDDKYHDDDSDDNVHDNDKYNDIYVGDDDK
jgi:hypothetical protein